MYTVPRIKLALPVFTNTGHYRAVIEIKCLRYVREIFQPHIADFQPRHERVVIAVNFLRQLPQALSVVLR